MDGELATRDKWAKAGDMQPDAIIQRAHDAHVTRLLCVGCTVEDSQLAVALVQKHEDCWASIGVHPHEAQRYLEDSESHSIFRQLAAKPKVVAIGECGLDYFYTHSPKVAQIAVLRMQFELAIERNLPMVFHVRDAFDDFWSIFESYYTKERPIRGVIHSFTDTQANLKRATMHGLYIGVNGIATFAKDPDQQAMYAAIPLKHLLLETDAPFLTPTPYRGTICEPYHVGVTATFLSQQRSESVETLAQATTRNARILFGV